jgi:predicted RNA-binding Zn-ribbon protein involved in translation (DUF1610 family)
MSAIYEYYDEEWRAKVFQCPKCGWGGTHDEMAGPNIFEELVDYGCPNCPKMLLIISHPFMSQTIEAAAAGNEHALYELGVRSMKGEHWEDFKRRTEEANQVLEDEFKNHDGPKRRFAGGWQVFNGPPDSI